MHLKITQILQIFLKKFCEFSPRCTKKYWPLLSFDAVKKNIRKAMEALLIEYNNNGENKKGIDTIFGLIGPHQGWATLLTSRATLRTSLVLWASTCPCKLILLFFLIKHTFSWCLMCFHSQYVYLEIFKCSSRATLRCLADRESRFRRCPSNYCWFLVFEKQNFLGM